MTDPAPVQNWVGSEVLAMFMVDVNEVVVVNWYGYVPTAA
eukprot:CAMPEP_0176438936 /NCGR_PEP_ID=MMETSP0127-20121128/19615_1 /TAXON_ID=938130 /ORGANISM="Platyophrya macrostoma, Strain WH" /LENGTH=39 /DNA_ID= /DNA_START= /DNA_END= /DNA_ORIENTATION=